MGSFLIELKWHCSTTFYEEKIIKILLDVGSPKKKEKKKKTRVERGKKADKVPLDPWQEAMVDPVD